MSIEVGSVVNGVVSGITKFGAFIELPEGKVGLCHISEISNVYVNEVSDFLKEKDKVKVKVLTVDANGKIGLSIKKAQEPKPQAPQPEQRERQGGGFAQNRSHFAANNDFKKQPSRFTGGPLSFEDKLSKFLKDSDERLSDLKKKTDSKRGGRGSRHSG